MARSTVKPTKSNEEVLQECIEKYGNIPLTIAFLADGKRLRKMDIGLQVRSPGAVHALPEEVWRALRNL